MATTANSGHHACRPRSHTTNDRHRSDEHGIRRVGNLTLCKLRDSITRGQALSKSWAAAVAAFPRSGSSPAHGPRSVTSPPTSSASAGDTAAAAAMLLTDLPYTVFAEIVSHLSAREAVAARRVSRDLRTALTRPELCISLLLQHFPRAREARELRAMMQRGGGGDPSPQLESVCWADALAATARRYHHLGTATPRATRTVPVARDDGLLRGVTPWHRFLRLDEKTAAFHYWDPVWTCDAGAGLMVHPVAGRRYVLRDIDTGRAWPVPFETAGRLVRRVRLSHGILIFEWCEAQAMREGEGEAHRHFATAYDVKRVRRRDGDEDGEEDLYTVRRYAIDKPGGREEAAQDECTVTIRAEWKIHCLGILLRHQDRFFSTHNSTHYAVYIWQPSRSPWGEDEPLERLIVWEFGGGGGSGPSLAGRTPPRIITELNSTQLEHWGVRQRGAPALRGLVLDDRTWDPRASSAAGHVFVVEEEHRWSAGPHSRATLPRLHHVKTTGIPLAGGATGPRWVDECGKVRPDASQMQFCRRAGGSGPGGATETATWAGRCPCWRHDDFPYLTVGEVHDARAGVRFSARHCFMLETLSVHVKPRLRVHGVARPATRGGGRRGSTTSGASSVDSSSSSSGGGKSVKAVGSGRRAGEEKARRDHAYKARDGTTSGMAAGSETKSEGFAVATREIQFGDDAWAMLLNAGYICGDERWLIGEDTEGSITIMHF